LNGFFLPTPHQDHHRNHQEKLFHARHPTPHRLWCKCCWGQYGYTRPWATSASPLRFGISSCALPCPADPAPHFICIFAPSPTPFWRTPNGVAS
jgi:hypothetical protein